LVLDIDGTIVDKDGQISNLDKESLSEVRKSGLAISLCTGRSTGSCIGVIEHLHLDGLHTFCDGALVCNSDQTQQIYIDPIEGNLVKQLCDITNKNNIALELYTATDCLINRETPISAIERDFFGINPRITDFTNIWQNERIIKGGIVTSSPVEEDRVKVLSKEFTESLDFGWAKTPAYPNMCFINVTAAGVNKGRALRALAKHLGIDMEEVVAIGDGNNDITLLAEAGMAIAMGNAPENLKSLADYITGDVNHSGVAQAVRKFLL
jgi:5-amino-6-(5-phospho-D-ribitylamino)uracil phosphatase